MVPLVRMEIPIVPMVPFRIVRFKLHFIRFHQLSARPHSCPRESFPNYRYAYKKSPQKGGFFYGAASSNGNSHCSNGPLSHCKVQTSFHLFSPTICSASRLPRESFPNYRYAYKKSPQKRTVFVWCR